MTGFIVGVVVCVAADAVAAIIIVKNRAIRQRLIDRLSAIGMVQEDENGYCGDPECMCHEDEDEASQDQA